MKFFLYYVGADDEQKQFLGQFFDAVSLYLGPEKAVNGFLIFYPKLQLEDKQKMKTISKRFFDIIKHLPKAKEFFSKFSEKDFDFNSFFSGLGYENFNMNNFITKWQNTTQVQ